MTSNEKRLMLIKKIINSDNDGINILYDRLTKSCCKDSNITEEDIAQAAAHVFAEMSVEDPELIVLMPIFAHGISEILKTYLRRISLWEF